jgi:hypothetical protein
MMGKRHDTEASSIADDIGHRRIHLMDSWIVYGQTKAESASQAQAEERE